MDASRDMRSFTVQSRFGAYSVQRRADAWPTALLGDRKTVVVVDDNVWRLHGDLLLGGVEDPVVLRVDESAKTLATAEWLYDQMLARGLRRDGCLLSIGGGITQDLTGFTASTLFRGVMWVFAPTTLLAQADSCIGAKTSLNHRTYKNVLGTMYAPSSVILDGRFLTTLLPQDFFSGLGEVVKLHVLGGPAQAAALARRLEDVVARDPGAVAAAVDASLRTKLPFIEQDEFDKGRRNLLNFGHCFGHALEAASGYEVSHGQAVVLGMLLAEVVAERRGLAGSGFRAELEERLLLPALATRIALDDEGRRAVVEAMRHDKKRRSGAQLALVMCCDGYDMTRVDDLAEDEAYDALQWLARW